MEFKLQMRFGLNSSMGLYYTGSIIGVTQGDTRSLDYSSNLWSFVLLDEGYLDIHATDFPEWFKFC